MSSQELLSKADCLRAGGAVNFGADFGAVFGGGGGVGVGGGGGVEGVVSDSVGDGGESGEGFGASLQDDIVLC